MGVEGRELTKVRRASGSEACVVGCSFEQFLWTRAVATNLSTSNGLHAAPTTSAS